jgi:NAD+ synthase (glutamine-hydrolysing)
MTVLVGFAEPAAGDGEDRRAHNSLAVLADGEVRGVYRKNRLPNYAVFDEQRYFVPGTEPLSVDVAGLPVGLTICEDVWVSGPPAETEAAQGAKLIANPSGSPYHRGKGHERVAMFAERSRAYGTYFAFCNLVGGQDELVFDGDSLVVDVRGQVLARAPQFTEDLLVVDLDLASCSSARSRAPGRSGSPSRSLISTRSTRR